MVCIYCNGPTSVTNSRLQRRSNNIWRRRECGTCGNIFTTHEIVELGGSIVVQRSSNNNKDIDPFLRDTLFISIYESCKHREDATNDANAITQTVINKILKLVDKGTIGRNQIVDIAFKTLDSFDKTAATVYIAYHPIR